MDMLQLRDSLRFFTGQNHGAMQAIIRRVFAALLVATAVVQAWAGQPPRVRMQTNLGTIILQLDPERAPETVNNFLTYVTTGFYDGTIFHRVIDGFMIQGGGYTQAFEAKEKGAAIRNEADNGLKNRRGAIAMARTNDPHSATSQFFINVVDNAFLDHSSPTPQGWGYAVFGEVVEGMDVVDRIKGIRTSSDGPFPGDVPTTPVIIEQVTVVPPKKEE